MPQIKIEETVELPENVKAGVEGNTLTVEGPKGKTSKNFEASNIATTVEEGKIVLRASRGTKKERQKIGTFKAHTKNMLTGVTEGHRRKLKVCSGHFPMTVKVEGNELTVKNFVGEKTPRKLTIPEGVKVKAEGAEVEIESCDKELLGNVASGIEHMTKRNTFDKRIFQDGIITIP